MPPIRRETECCKLSPIWERSLYRQFPTRAGIEPHQTIVEHSHPLPVRGESNEGISSSPHLAREPLGKPDALLIDSGDIPELDGPVSAAARQLLAIVRKGQVSDQCGVAKQGGPDLQGPVEQANRVILVS